ncbi:unnamed protein product, partial [Allacma fusca]
DLERPELEKFEKIDWGEKPSVEKKAKRKPKDIRSREVPKEFTEITGPDGQPSIVEVQEALAVEVVGPDGIPVLQEVTNIDEILE